MKKQKNENTDTAIALHASDRAGAPTAARATASASYHRSSLFASMVAGATMALGASALAGVNLANDAKPPGYSQPLTVYQRDGKIYAAWAVGSNGSQDAPPFQVGFYVRGQRQLVATFSNGLRRGWMGYGTDAPLNLPVGDSVVELKINDTRWTTEDKYSDNSYAITVRVNGGGGGTPPVALTRSEAAYKFPSTLGNSSASRVISRMTDMFNAQWTPSANFVNYRASGESGGYTKGTRYYGLPYSQANPQTDVTGFIGYLPQMVGTLNSTSSAGVDCSGSISIAWQLPSRHTTSTFDVDNSSHFTTVVANGKLAVNASKIQPGDAIVSKSWGHMVLVTASPANGKVEVMEATADYGRNLNGDRQSWAVVKNTRSLSDLDAKYCRVIRRNKL